MKSGVYEIKNITDNKIYIGSSVNIKHRVNRHFKDLRNGNHHSAHLQRAFDKYGEKNFKHRVIAYAPREDVISLEQKYFDLLKPEYNTCKVAGNCTGVKHSKATVDKNRIRNTGFGNGNAKLTPTDMNKVIKMRKSKTVTQIAAHFNVHRSTIERAISRYTNLSFDRLFSEEGKALISKKCMGNNRAGLSVAKINDRNEVIEVFPNITSAAKSVERTRCAVSSAISRNGKCAGFRFKFVNQ